MQYIDSLNALENSLRTRTVLAEDDEGQVIGPTSLISGLYIVQSSALVEGEVQTVHLYNKEECPKEITHQHVMHVLRASDLAGKEPKFYDTWCQCYFEPWKIGGLYILPEDACIVVFADNNQASLYRQGKHVVTRDLACFKEPGHLEFLTNL